MGKHGEQTALTKQSIEDAFWIIAAEGASKNISISAIAKKAGINRSTFYEYFANLSDLINEAQEKIFAGLREAFSELYISYKFNCTAEDISKVLSPYCGKMAILLRCDSNRQFADRIRQEAFELFSSLTGQPDRMMEYEIVYIVSAFTGVLLYREESGKEIDGEQFMQLIHTMSIRGFSGLHTGEKQ